MQEGLADLDQGLELDRGDFGAVLLALPALLRLFVVVELAFDPQDGTVEHVDARPEQFVEVPIECGLGHRGDKHGEDVGGGAGSEGVVGAVARIGLGGRGSVPVEFEVGEHLRGGGGSSIGDVGMIGHGVAPRRGTAPRAAFMATGRGGWDGPAPAHAPEGMLCGYPMAASAGAERRMAGGGSFVSRCKARPLSPRGGKEPPPAIAGPARLPQTTAPSEGRGRGSPSTPVPPRHERTGIGVDRSAAGVAVDADRQEARDILGHELAPQVVPHPVRTERHQILVEILPRRGERDCIDAEAPGAIGQRVDGGVARRIDIAQDIEAAERGGQVDGGEMRGRERRDAWQFWQGLPHGEDGLDAFARRQDIGRDAEADAASTQPTHGASRRVDGRLAEGGAAEPVRVEPGPVHAGDGAGRIRDGGDERGPGLRRTVPIRAVIARWMEAQAIGAQKIGDAARGEIGLGQRDTDWPRHGEQTARSIG